MCMTMSIIGSVKMVSKSKNIDEDSYSICNCIVQPRTSKTSIQLTAEMLFSSLAISFLRSRSNRFRATLFRLSAAFSAFSFLAAAAAAASRRSAC